MADVSTEGAEPICAVDLWAGIAQRMPTKGNLVVSFVSAVGKEGVFDGTVPVRLLDIVRHTSQTGETALSIP